MLQQQKKPWNPCSWRGLGVGVTQRGKVNNKRGEGSMENVHQGRNELGFSPQGSAVLNMSLTARTKPKKPLQWDGSCGTGEQEESLCCLQ